MTDSLFPSAAAAIDWINGARYMGEKNGLSNMRALLAALGNPQDSLRCLHVAGTNGKGSTCAMLERMLRGCGLKTGLYTSPYLMRFEERMRVGGVPIPAEPLRRIASRVRREAEALVARGVKPTTFELGTAAALCYFLEERVDVAVIEVGLGGRLDPTNVITPLACLIAPIGLDHVRLLGDTVEKIAFEKAGILKPGVPAAIARQPEGARRVLREVAAAQNVPLYDLSEHEIVVRQIDARGARFSLDGQEAEIRLAGRHQVDNACLALSGIRLLRGLGWPLANAEASLPLACWPGRLEWLDDGLLIDGAHNPHGARALAAYAKEFLSGRKIVLLTGMMRDKDVEECAAVYASFAHSAVATRVDYPRAMEEDALRDILARHGLDARAEGSIPCALKKARRWAGSEGVVVVCGSLYLVGDVRLRLRDDKGRV